MLKQKYEIADNLPDIVAKNKHNIINLDEQLTETNSKLKDTELKIGNMNYYTDKADFLAKTKIGAFGYTAGYSAGTHMFMIHEANGVEEFWNIEEIKDYIRKQTAGLGEYIGTFYSSSRDDISVLPTANINDGDTCIMEFPNSNTDTTEKFQEYKWEVKGDPASTGWFKRGDERDSHHHSQSSGITLADVARQQDPKIAKKQNNLEMDLNDAPFGKVISTNAILTSNKIDGSRKVPVIEYELVDKKYVDDEIKKHSGGSTIIDFRNIPVLADPSADKGDMFKIDNTVANIQFDTKDHILNSYKMLQGISGEGYKIYVVDSVESIFTPEALILTGLDSVRIKWIIGIKFIEGLK